MLNINDKCKTCTKPLSSTSLHNTAGSTAFRRAEFGEGSGIVYLEGLECTGDEDSLLDCPMDVELGLSLCEHSNDAGIRCHGMTLPILL